MLNIYLLPFSNNSYRVTSNYDIFWHIFANHTAGTNNAMNPNCLSWLHNALSSHPYTVTDYCPFLDIVGTLPPDRDIGAIKGMSSWIHNVAMRSHHYIFPNERIGGNITMNPNATVVANLNSFSIAKVCHMLNVNIFTTIVKQLFCTAITNFTTYLT